MIEIDKAIVSFDVVKEHFCCDLATCKGACCVEGDGGAPLEDKEIALIASNLETIKKQLSEKSIASIDTHGFYYTDTDGDKLTALNDGKECTFTIFVDDIAFCGIEKAYLHGEIPIRKPISCYLYPIRITKYARFEGVNYHKWYICDCARKKGNTENMRVFEFLKAPLIENYGKDWYELLEKVVAENNNFVARKSR